MAVPCHTVRIAALDSEFFENSLSNREFKAILTKVGDFPLNNDEVDEIYNALGLSENDEIPINDIIALFTQFE